MTVKGFLNENNKLKKVYGSRVCVNDALYCLKSSGLDEEDPEIKEIYESLFENARRLYEYEAKREKNIIKELTTKH